VIDITTICEAGHSIEGSLNECIVCGGWYCKEHISRDSHNCKTSTKHEAKPTKESLPYI
jgi:hypothetical protein